MVRVRIMSKNMEKVRGEPIFIEIDKAMKAIIRV